jgi:hypothetical protein
MKKQQRVSKAAFDMWFNAKYGKVLTDKQINALFRERIKAESALELARTRVDIALEIARSYEDCLAAWQDSREAYNE